MVVKVNVEVKKGGKIIKSPSVLNTGYEAGEEPEIHLPTNLAKELEFDLRGAMIDVYQAMGSRVNAYVLGSVEVKAVEPDRETNWIKAKAVSVEGEDEVVISDKLIGEFGIIILNPALGKWKFRGERKVRRSV